MRCGELRAQRADAARPDDCEPDLFAFDDLPLSKAEHQVTADERR
jgi:hypothetical protein